MIQTFFEQAWLFTTNYYVQYIVLGLLYATAKWIYRLFKLRSAVNAIDSTKYKTAEELHKQREYAAAKFFGEYEYPPRAGNNKGRLLSWSVFWPIDLVWTLIADVTKEVFKFIYRKIGSAYDAIARKILPE